MSAGLAYFERATQLLDAIRRTQLGHIQAAADICTRCISSEGLVFLFGAGHSRMMCEEMTPRQGGFVGFYALVEAAVSNHSAIVGTNGLAASLHLEKYEGYAEEILRNFGFGPNDAFILISTSGIRPLIVEMAIGARDRGLPVIAIVSRSHCEQSEPAHASGMKLIDLADVVIDNQAPAGDCVLEIEGMEWRTGPVSTVTGGMIINMLRAEVAERLVAAGVTPVVLPSHQFIGDTGAEDQLERYYQAYRRSLSHLYD